MKFKNLIMSLGLSSSLFIAGCNGGGSSPSSSAADQVLASSQKARSLYNQLSPKYQAMFQQQMATDNFSPDNIGNIVVSGLKVWGKFSKIMDPYGEVGGLGLNFLNAVLGWNSTPNYTPYFTEIISELNQIQQGIVDTQNLVYDQSSLIISELDQQNLTHAADNLSSIENGTFWKGFKNDISGVAESQLTSESAVANVDVQLGSILKLLYNDYTPLTISQNADCLVSESIPTCATVEDYNNVSRNVSAFEAYALTAQKVLYDKDILTTNDLDNYNDDLAYEYVKATALLQEFYTITQFALAASYNPYVSNNTYGDNYYYKYLTFYDDNLEKTLSQSQALTNLYGDYLLRELNLMQQYERNIISDSVAPAGINPIKPSYIPAHNFGALGKVFQGGNWGNSCNFYVWADLDGSYLGETYTENNQFESSLLPTISLPAFSGSFVNGTTITAQCLNPVSNNMETVSNNYNNLFCTANTGPDYVLTNPNTNNQKGVLQCSSFRTQQDFLNVDPNEDWALLANQYGYSIPLNGEPHVIIQQGTTPPYALIGVQPNSRSNTISEVVGPFAWLPVNYDWYLNSKDVDGGAFGADNWFTIWQYNSPDGFKGLFKIISGVNGDPIWNDATQLSCMDSDPTCSRIVVSDARGGLAHGIGSEICLSHHLLSLGIYVFDTNYDNEFMEVHDEGGC